jgi:uncharacterized membrane protein YdjX (TVP38/TMEM64 family)
MGDGPLKRHRAHPRLYLGLTTISLPVYVLASLVCMLPGTIAYTWLG